MNEPSIRPREWYLEHLALDVARIEKALATVDLDAPVATCPGWNVVDLVAHVSFVHRWARACATDAAPPSKEQMATMSWTGGDDRDGLAAWFREGADEIVATLREVDLDGPTWHPFPVPLVGRVWPRRQAHEICIHRWDLERAAGATTPIDPVLAADGIDEYFEIAIPRLVARDGVTLPTPPLRVACIDADDSWIVSSADGYRVDDDGEHAATISGRADTLLLALWGRAAIDELDVDGDRDVATAWLAVAGM